MISLEGARNMRQLLEVGKWTGTYPACSTRTPTTTSPPSWTRHLGAHRPALVHFPLAIPSSFQSSFARAMRYA